MYLAILFTLIRTKEYTRKTLLDESVAYQQALIQQNIIRGKYRGKPIFLPPKYFDDPEALRAFISKREDNFFSASDFRQIGNSILLTVPSGMLITPPGASLMTSFEEILEKNFRNVDLEYLQVNLSKVIVDDLEIAQDFRMQVKDRNIEITVKNCIFKVSTKTDETESDNLSNAWSPLNSAIACAIAKASNQSVIMEELQTTNGKDLKITYKIIDEAQPET